jgi:hypothetical protein
LHMTVVISARHNQSCNCSISGPVDKQQLSGP